MSKQNKPIEPVQAAQASEGKGFEEMVESCAVKISKDHYSIRIKPDYDMSIHTNPDARAWAEFWNECAMKRGEERQDVGFMTGWFANAMMAMHDFQKKKHDAEVLALLEGLKEAEEALDQCQDYAVIYNNAVPATLCKEALKTIRALLSTEAQQ